MIVSAPEGANRVANEDPCIPYLHAGPLPIFIGFAPDEKSFLAEMERLGTKEIPPYTISDATTHHFRSDDGMTCIVCIKPRKGICKEQWIGLLVHEAAHVWQAIRESMEEDNPSAEFEAYTLQYISQWLVGQALFPEPETI